ncbi:Ger(x)C family spore germination protein [Bacillus sp. sid0103]|uniref:Ger(x)C family spore germination protein n=1 Tax=Bacillus sp. sid0103 TaxID=2856337 RepID=UPI001C481568|nr:Ger(x)C family spore germination protein [Bacillus sp. sid0103]MBV7507805.1 Ger(x)C family spore germination protein [Bacillus sp. sid0103]
MKKKNILHLVFCFSFFFISGCWDSKELNERAIWLASGYDSAKNNGVEISGQIVIPSNMQTQGGSGGATEKGFFTISASGKNPMDCLDNIQLKLPRELFTGQRRVIILGEQFARRGLKKMMDANQRSPEVSLRTDIFVIKGATAKEALSLTNPLEKPPATAALSIHEESGGRGNTTYLNFMSAANSDGLRPTLPVLEFSSSQNGKKAGKVGSANPPLLRVAGVAIFDQNLKMRGLLNMEENKHMLWVMGILKKFTISIAKKDSNASLQLNRISSKIKPHISHHNQIKFIVTLKGEGSLRESNSNLDVQYHNNLKQREKEFETYAQKQVQQTIKKVQNEYGLDIFGFGEVIHRKNPKKWKSLKNDWDKKFSEAEITVKADVKITDIGMNGPSLLYKESGVKK